MVQKRDECKSRFKDCYGNHKSGGGGWLAGMNVNIVLRIDTAIKKVPNLGGGGWGAGVYLCYLLYISTSFWVLRTPKAGRNLRFQQKKLKK